MTIISDRSMRDRMKFGALSVAPITPEAIQPASVDLTLGARLLALPYGVTMDPEVDQSDQWYPLPLRSDGRWFVNGMRLHLGATAEQIRVPRDCVGVLSGVSTLGRQGLLVHATAGFVDPGWVGNLTLELVLLGQAILLRPGMRIAQVTFYSLDRDAERPYRGRYAGDVLPTPSKVR